MSLLVKGDNVESARGIKANARHGPLPPVQASMGEQMDSTRTKNQDYLNRSGNFYSTVLNIFSKNPFLATPNVENEC